MQRVEIGDSHVDLTWGAGQAGVAGGIVGVLAARHAPANPLFALR